MQSFILLCLLFILSSCNQSKPALNIAVASNFESTLKLIIEKYQQSGKKLTINIISGSSGILANQIINKAPFDLFLSADTLKPQLIFEKEKLSHKPVIYAIGQLALWLPQSLTNNNCLQQLSSINSLAIANPKTAPYGSLATKIMQENNVELEKVIYTANISQAFLYTEQKFTQAGFIANSMLDETSKGCIQVFQSDTLNQSMLLLNDQAQEFYHYILSKEIQTLIKSSGYNTVQ